jgi:hypothetical protein
VTLSHRRSVIVMLPALVVLGASFPFHGFIAEVLAAASLPRVVLSAESLAPRPIEQRTGEAVAHDYAQAWQDLAVSLDTNRTDLLGDYFAGEAKRRIAQRIAEQKSAHLRTRYLDAGHRVKAVFYSVDGGEMQLEDQAELEIQVFDGEKLIATSKSTQKYLVLMTPGSDRWYVRYLESVGDKSF